MLSLQLECPKCRWRTLCGDAEILARLRKLALFRRATDPPDDLVREMVLSHRDRLTCDNCGHQGLQVNFDPSQNDGDQWEQAVICEVCRKPIPAERLEFLPNATRCAICQNAADRGQLPVEPEYCPKCGSLVELRVSRGGGVTRYKLFCTGSPACRL